MARKHTIIRALDRYIVQGVRCLITLYQVSLSVVIGRQCRFYPSCSHYTAKALEQHGSMRGLRLGLLRILRCGPWHPGGFDPVPPLINQQGNYEHSSNRQLCGCCRTWGAVVDNVDEGRSSTSACGKCCGKSCGEFCGK